MSARRCSIPRCSKIPAKNRHVCDTCRDRIFRDRHPIAHLFNNNKKHARQRGIIFTLTKAQFTEFCLRTGYHLAKGRDREGMTIDRIHSHLGYCAGNIRMITNGANSSKNDRAATPEEIAEAVELEA